MIFQITRYNWTSDRLFAKIVSSWSGHSWTKLRKIKRITKISSLVAIKAEEQKRNQNNWRKTECFRLLLATWKNSNLLVAEVNRKIRVQHCLYGLWSPRYQSYKIFQFQAICLYRLSITRANNPPEFVVVCEWTCFERDRGQKNIHG